MPLLHRLRIFVCASAVLAAAAAPAAAASVQVTTTADSGPGSLREALATAGAGDTITFALPTPATISITTGSLHVSKDVTVAGPGVSQLAVHRDESATTLFSVFTIDDGVTATISGMTISGGDMTDYYGASAGAGIYNYGNLTLSKVLVARNRAFYGAIWSDNHANLVLVDSTVIDNDLLSDGYYPAFAVWVCCDTGSLTIRRSTVSTRGSDGAAAIGVYGGYYSGGSIGVRIENSTIDGSFSSMNRPSSITVDSSTLTASTDWDLWGAWYGDSISLRNSILVAAANHATIGYGITSTSLGFNLFSDAAGGTLTTTDQVSADPKLGPLQDNDGPTPPHALLPGSPAIDTGSCSDSGGATVTVDQRGIARPRGSACDIGSFESASKNDLQVDHISQLVDATLDTAVSSRATQASVDQLDSKVLTIDGHLMTDVLPLVQALGTAVAVVSTQVSGVATGVLGVSSSVTDVLTAVSAVSTALDAKASQASVDALGTSTRQGLSSVSTALLALSTNLPPANAFATLQSSVDGVGTTVASRATQASVDALTRYAIELALSGGTPIATYVLPQSAGGLLEVVRQIVDQTVTGMRTIGVDTRKASASLARGDAAYSAGNYKAAYDSFAYAYQLLVK
jgi:hypothetical protein